MNFTNIISFVMPAVGIPTPYNVSTVHTPLKWPANQPCCWGYHQKTLATGVTERLAKELEDEWYVLSDGLTSVQGRLGDHRPPPALLYCLQSRRAARTASNNVVGVT